MFEAAIMSTKTTNVLSKLNARSIATEMKDDFAILIRYYVTPFAGG
jgi:hypothetical protein